MNKTNPPRIQATAIGSRLWFYLYLASALAIYLLIYFPAYYTPINTDDYCFQSMGLGLDTHWHRYLTVGGRVIVDYFSSLLVVAFSKPVYMAIDSFVLLVMLVAVSFLPSTLAKQSSISAHSLLILWLAFFIYWLANPALGETVYWVAGSTNYTWLFMWAGLYFLYLFWLLTRAATPSYKNVIPLVVISIFVGLSHEIVSVSVGAFTFALLFIYKKQRTFIAIALVTVFLSFLVLYFSPGNAARTAAAYSVWLERSLTYKILMHFFYRVPIALYEILPALIIGAVLFVPFWRARKSNADLKIFAIFTVLFLGLAAFSLAVIVRSPIMPSRAVSPALFFVLLAISFMVYALLNSASQTSVAGGGARTCYKPLYIVGIPVAILSAVFAVSYVLFSYSMVQLQTQTDIVNETLWRAKDAGRQSAKIPDLYFTRLLKDKDKMPHGGVSGCISPYFKIENVEMFSPSFNYAILKTKKPIVLDFNGSLSPAGVFLDNGHGFFDTDKLVFEFNAPLQKLALNGEDMLFVHLFVKGRDGFVSRDLPITDFAEIAGKFYYTADLSGIALRDLKGVKLSLLRSSSSSRHSIAPADLANYALMHRLFKCDDLGSGSGLLHTVRVNLCKRV